MASVSDYLKLIVPEYIPMGITGLLVGAVASLNALPGARFWVAAACVAFIISGYNSYNAIIDKDIDIINKPYRPLPKGILSEKKALHIALISYAIAFLLALTINTTFLVIATATILLTIAYSHPIIHLKKRFLIGTLSAVTLYTFLAPLLGWSIYPNNPIPLPIILFIFFLGLPKGIMKDYVDLVGDAYHRIQSLPVQLGYKSSILMVLLFYLLSAIFLCFLVYEKLIPTSFLTLIVFYPFMLWNVYCLPKKFDSNTRNDFAFIKAMIILILIELTITVMLIYKPTIPELNALVNTLS